MKATAVMKFGGLSAVYAVAQIILCASTQAQPSGIPGATYVEPLGIALEGWPYPYQVRFMPLESWLYWIVIDMVLAWLYAVQGLVFTAFLFLVYLAIAAAGFIEWFKTYRRQTAG